MFSRAIFQIKMSNIKFLYSLFFLILFFSIGACSENKNSTLKQDKNICKYSKWLQIIEKENSVIIKITNPNYTEQVMTFSSGIATEKVKVSPINYLSLPCNKIASLASTHIGMLSVLNCENSICAVSDEKFVYNEELKRGILAGNILSLGDAQEISIERLVNSGAKIVVHSAFSGPFPKSEQLKKIGITCIPNYDWREENPLGKAEWILLFGYLTGKQELAKKIFSEIVESYNQTRKKVKNNSNMKVICGNFFRDFWYAPAGESYNGQLIKDAGMNYIYRNTKGTGSISISMEKILMETKDINLWLNPGFSSKSAILESNPKAKNLACFKNAKIYCYSHNLNRFWELSAVQPHLILEDFYSITNLDSPSKLHFYRQLK